jgi:hypothetical protein
LDTLIDTLIPTYREALSPIPIPTFQGRSVYHKLEPGGVSGRLDKSGLVLGKDYTWSKGLGFEISPIKTQSACKKANNTPSLPMVHQTNLSEFGVLRGMKSLARAKP